jgi:hypothetical protein
MKAFYSPHPQEIPKGFENQFKSFGMGPEAAKNLARRLSLSKPSGPIILLGSAGGLKDHLKPGDCFIIHEIYLKTGFEKLSIPRSLKFLPQARLVSVEQPVTRSEIKRSLGQSSDCDLVDCEMSFFWDEISDDLKSRIIFIRGVLDPASENLDFLKAYKINWQGLVRPRNLFQFLKFVRNFFQYQSGIEAFFKKVADQLQLRDDSEVTSEIDLF